MLRVALAGAVYFAGGGEEFSGDVPLITYAAEHPACMWVGSYDRQDRFFRDTVVNWGPLLGGVVAGPLAIFKSFTPDFLAIRFAFIFLETLGFALFYVLSRRGGSPFGGGAPRALVMGVWLPLGWMATAVWVQEEILIAPFLLLAVVAAARDKPGTTAVAIVLAAFVTKFIVFAFVPAAWLVMRQRRRFALYVAASLIPILAYSAYVKVQHGLLPFVGFDPVSGPWMSLSVFTLYGQGRWLFDWPPLGQAAGPIAKIVLAAALAGATAVGYKIVRSSASREGKAGLKVWALFAATFLLFNCMSQPEYLAWYAFLAPVLLTALVPRRAVAAAAAGVVALCLLAWGWNVLNGILVHGELAGGGFRHDFAGRVISSVGLEAVRLATFGSAVVYLTLTVGVLILIFRTVRQAAETSPASSAPSRAWVHARD
ncbi:MAG: hypothetical protein V3W11_04975 [bacterium]